MGKEIKIIVIINNCTGAPSGASDNTVGDGYRWERWVAQGRACHSLTGLGASDTVRLVPTQFFPLTVIQMEPARTGQHVLRCPRNLGSGS